MKTLPVLVPSWKSIPANVHAFTTLRSGGFSVAPYGDINGGNGLNLGDHVGDDPTLVKRNRVLLESDVGLSIHYLSQVHSNKVVNGSQIGDVVCADAVVTDQKNVVCAVLTADCLPVLFSDFDGKVVGAAHAGWRGLAGGILENTVSEMRELGAKNLFAWLGPAIGPRQFEVGKDVLECFTDTLGDVSEYFEEKQGCKGKFLADIYGLARLTLQRVGVTDVYGGDHCTVSQPQQFFSYRRDGVTGRMASLIWTS